MTLQGYIPSPKIKVLKILFIGLYLFTFGASRIIVRLLSPINEQLFIIGLLSMIAITWLTFFWADSKVIENIIFIGDHYVRIKEHFFDLNDFKKIEIKLNEKISAKRELNKGNHIKFYFKDNTIFESPFNINGEFVINLESFKSNFNKIEIKWL